MRELYLIGGLIILSIVLIVIIGFAWDIYNTSKNLCELFKWIEIPILDWAPFYSLCKTITRAFGLS